MFINMQFINNYSIVDQCYVAMDCNLLECIKEYNEIFVFNCVPKIISIFYFNLLPFCLITHEIILNLY